MAAAAVGEVVGCSYCHRIGTGDRRRGGRRQEVKFTDCAGNPNYWAYGLGHTSAPNIDACPDRDPGSNSASYSHPRAICDFQ